MNRLEAKELVEEYEFRFHALQSDKARMYWVRRLEPLSAPQARAIFDDLARQVEADRQEGRRIIYPKVDSIVEAARGRASHQRATKAMHEPEGPPAHPQLVAATFHFCDRLSNKMKSGVSSSDALEELKQSVAEHSKDADAMMEWERAWSQLEAYADTSREQREGDVPFSKDGPELDDDIPF